MKIALIHDYIKEYGGAEKVLEALHEIWPEASVYTLVYLPEFLGPHKDRFSHWDIRPSILNHIPFRAKLISPFRLASPFIFRSFDLSSYDVIVVSQAGAYFPNLVRKTKDLPRSPRGEAGRQAGQKLITYTHTTPRYLYGYKTAREWKRNILFRIMGEIANHFLRVIDFQASKNVDYFIANSEEVKSR